MLPPASDERLERKEIETLEAIIALIVVVVLLLVLIVRNIHVVQQSKAYVIERMGAFSTVWQVGIHFKIPFIEKVAKKVSLKE